MCRCPHVEGGRRLSSGSRRMETWARPLGQEGGSGYGEKRSALGNVERGSLYFQGSPVHLLKGDQQSGGDRGGQGHGWRWEQMAGRVTSVVRLSGPIIPPDGPPALLLLPAPGRGCRDKGGREHRGAAQKDGALLAAHLDALPRHLHSPKNPRPAHPSPHQALVVFCPSPGWAEGNTGQFSVPM